MVDEIVYSELARGIASGEGLSIRGHPAGLGYGLVYPVLISPAYLLDSLPAAYAAVKAINAVLISLAAVPAYFLARRVLTPGYALVAALLALPETLPPEQRRPGSLPQTLRTFGGLLRDRMFTGFALSAALAWWVTRQRPEPGGTIKT